MLTQLKTLARAIGEAKSVVTTELGPITPPPLDEVRDALLWAYGLWLHFPFIKLAELISLGSDS